MKYKELVYWNTVSYGNAIRIDKKVLILSFVTVCLLTPCTNWLIVFVKKLIKNDFIIRY